jgi:tRNA nucleotidyltransferase (CCA-adding enzyme)
VTDAFLQGKEAETLLELRPGPIVGVIRAAVNAWQLDHPDATVDECAAWLKGMWEGQGRVEWEAALPPVQVKGKQSKSKQKDAKAEKRKR